MKPFQMPQPRHGRCHVAVQGRRAMTRQIDAVRLAQAAGLQESGYAAAAGIGLQHVHRLRRQHPLKVFNIVAVLAGRDVDQRRRMGTDEMQSG